MILENICLYVLTPVGGLFLLLLEVCQAWGEFLMVTGPCLSALLLRVPPFSSGASSQDMSVPSCD